MHKKVNPFQIIELFEDAVAEYAGSKYGVAVDSCTNALLLCCKYLKVKFVTIPKKTYVGVPQSILNAGGTPIFQDIKWTGAYRLEPYPIIDSARRFTRGMYVPGTLYCLSFHWTKHLSIGRGGMILCDDYSAYDALKIMRFDGRSEGVPPKNDLFNISGYHFYMTPAQAAEGITRLFYMKDNNDDIPNDDYSDLYKNFMVKP